MYQGTTPALTFLIQGMDLSAMTAYVSFGKGKKELLTKVSPEVLSAYDGETDITVIVVPLTQEETLSMKRGSVTVQARFIDQSENAYATDKVILPIEDVIYNQVITYRG